MEIIVPAAGLSTRFPGTKPKYLLEDVNSRLMISNAINPYLDQGNITIGVLQQHEELYNSTAIIKNELGSSVNIIVLPKITNGPADTVYQISKLASLPIDSSILIKDCDSYFNHDITDGNYVCISNVKNHDVMYKINNKSFVVTNEHGIIQSIVEKSIISNEFCVGGYKFNKLVDFITGYDQLSSSMKTEFFVSHIIQFNISKGALFFSNNVTDYVDVGTIQEWKKHCIQ